MLWRGACDPMKRIAQPTHGPALAGWAIRWSGGAKGANLFIRSAQSTHPVRTSPASLSREAFHVGNPLETIKGNQICYKELTLHYLLKPNQDFADFLIQPIERRARKYQGAS